MSENLSRRSILTLGTGIALAGLPILASAKQQPPQQKPDPNAKPPSPVETPFTRDYEAPGFNPKWKQMQLNRLMVQYFVIYAHMDLDKVKMLLAKEPRLIAAHMDWGGGDWESGLGGASHMGNKEIVTFLLEKGARMDIFCAASMNQLDTVQSMLKLQPNLIDSYGPHGMTVNLASRVQDAT